MWSFRSSQKAGSTRSWAMVLDIVIFKHWNEEVTRGVNFRERLVRGNAISEQELILKSIDYSSTAYFVAQFSWERSKPKDIKLSIVNKQCVVYHFSCDLCDADYVAYTAWHLHQRIAAHKNSAIGRHFIEAPGNKTLLKENQFTDGFKKVLGPIWLFSFWNALHQDS